MDSNGNLKQNLNQSGLIKNGNVPDLNSHLMNSRPARPDLFQQNFYRHLNECKSIITFLGSFCDYEYIRTELNDHITNLINR